MPQYILLVAVIIVTCVFLNKVSSKLGIPMLFAFIALGMIFGSDGIFKIEFDNYNFAQWVCSAALIFIMFYGGFGTNWNEAKTVAVKSALLASVGVVITAMSTGLFCYYILGFKFLESMLIGSVISSTDAASVFSVLRSKRLNLKYNTASMLEIESGSNDPCSYMLTAIFISIMNASATTSSVIYMVFAQIVYGTLCGLAVAGIALIILRKFRFETNGFDAAFVFAVAMISYAVPTIIGGNGYLSAYIVGIILGNNKIQNKRSLVHFLDGVTGIMQMLIFFLLGILAFPSQLSKVAFPSIAIALFLTFVARPLAVMAILTPAKNKFNQQLLVSWAGFRGAASIVFAVMAKSSNIKMENDIFHIVFFIVLLSLAFQSTFISHVAKKLDMIDDNENVLKTFTDYSGETPVQFIKIVMDEKNPWIGRQLKDIDIPVGTLLVLIIRNNKQIVPKGKTKVFKDDIMVLSALAYSDETKINLSEIKVTKSSKWNGKSISELEYNPDSLIIIIKRGKRFIIPNGRSVLKENDVLVISNTFN